MKKRLLHLSVAAIFLCVAAIFLCGLLMSSPALGEGKTIGILQYAGHPSLDNCTAGFLLGLEEGGYFPGDNVTISFQNAMGDMATSDMQAKNMAAARMDMLVGVATPAAMSAYAATKELGIPLVFVAVSDPIGAGIVKGEEAPGTNATGTSDRINIPAQLEMIRAFLPEATSIGVVYTLSEPNSLYQLEQLRAHAPDYGFTIEAIGIASGAEVAMAGGSLIARGVDAINNFTDNNVVENLALLLRPAGEAGIPVFGSEVEQVVNGCLAAQGIDYVELGKVSGRMAAQILQGEATPETMAVAIVDTTAPVYNSQVMEKLGLALPDALQGMADVAGD